MSPPITCAAGLVERNTLLRLSRGWEISALDRSDDGAFARFVWRPTQALGMETRLTYSGERDAACDSSQRRMDAGA